MSTPKTTVRPTWPETIAAELLHLTPVLDAAAVPIVPE
jgi:hypothetical protein